MPLRQRIANWIAPRTIKVSNDTLISRRFELPRPGPNGRAAMMGPLASEVMASAAQMRRSARHFHATNPWAAAGVAALTTAIVGDGITPAPKQGKAVQSSFFDWSLVCDADGLTTFNGLVAMAVKAMIVDGESFIVFLQTPDGLRLRLLPAELLDESYTVEGDRRRTVNGVEFDADGQRTAYWFLQQRPGDLYGTYLPPIRVDARDVVHLFVPIGPGVVRGISWLADVLLRLSELDQLEDALLVNAKVQAMMVGLLIDQNGTGGANPFEGTLHGNVLESGLEPGTLKYLPTGLDVKWSNPMQSQSAMEFADHMIRSIAAGMGVPSFMVSNDYSAINYSSARSALIGFRQHVAMIQWQWVIPRLQAIFERAVTAMILAGDLDAPGFEANPKAWTTAEWYPPAQPWVDPLKDQQAEALAVANGFKSRRQVVSSLGYSVEELDAEIAADKAREESLGLSFKAKPPSSETTVVEADEKTGRIKRTRTQAVE